MTRFAPSPTGRLHLGHAYSAQVAWRLARQNAGRFLLRFEDIDHTRVRAEYYEGIEDDLRWLGLGWDGEPLRQLTRLEAYDEGLNSLREMGVLYPCFCTRKNLALTAPQEGGVDPLYAGTCRHLSASERAEKVAQGESHCWRLESERASQMVGSLTFEEEGLGQIEVSLEALGDVVLARKDIATSYHLAVVLDDALQEVTEVVRGRDLFASTHVHRVLQELLQLPKPRYRHHGLVVDDAGRRLAKRHDALAIATLREEGQSPEEVLEQARKALEI